MKLLCTNWGQCHLERAVALSKLAFKQEVIELKYTKMIFSFLLFLGMLLIAGNMSYICTYDNLNRLTSVAYSNGTQITYTYDPAGNMTSVVTESLYSLQLTSPNGGENWVIGQDYNLTWTSENITGGIHIFVSEDQGLNWTQIFTNTPDDGSETWTVLGSEGDQVVFKVQANDTPGLWDASDKTLSFTTYCPSPIITSDPISAIKCPGESVTFNVVSNEELPTTYQWYKNGSLIDGATSTSLTINPIDSGDAGNYYSAVTNQCDVVNSATATLTVLTPIAISSHPQSQSPCIGDSIQLQVVASGSNQTYQWSKDSQIIQGATSNTLSLNTLDQDDEGLYTCEVSNDCGTQTSSAATVIVLEPLAITQQPVGESICVGSEVTLVVSATGPPPITYQWYKDVSLLTGETGASLTILDAQETDEGIYECQVTNACGTVGSDPAALTWDGQLNAFIQPYIRVLGLGVPSFTVQIDCEVPPSSIDWASSPTTTLVENGATVTLDPAPNESTTVSVTVADSSGSSAAQDEALLLVSMNPLFRDYNQDGCNNLQDLWDLLQEWRNQMAQDPNGDGVIDVIDLLYINLDEPTPCP
jgi:YD repeat-containing protein